MFGVSRFGAEWATLRWQGSLSEYVTALDWWGSTLAVASAAGQVALWKGAGSLQFLPDSSSKAVNALGFSADGRYLAAGGEGEVRLWQLGKDPRLFEHLPLNAWVEQLAWHPTRPWLAFTVGKGVQVWDADHREVLASLPFDNSSVLGLTWHPEGQLLTAGGYQGINVWDVKDWDEDPTHIRIPSASVAIAWSPDGRYLASGNLDRTVTLMEWGNPHPWGMRGFPGKVRHLAWSEPVRRGQDPRLVSVTGEALVVWEKDPQPQDPLRINWSPTPLEAHTDTVQTAAFRPGSLILASGSADGSLCIWDEQHQLGQWIDDLNQGIPCLGWDPKGQWLAVGGEQGDLHVWGVKQPGSRVRGRGFGR